MLNFEVFRKRGKHWECLGDYLARDSRSAALKASYVHHLKVVGVRPSGTPVKLFVYRFRQPAELHHG